MTTLKITSFKVKMLVLGLALSESGKFELVIPLRHVQSMTQQRTHMAIVTLGLN